MNSGDSQEPVYEPFRQKKRRGRAADIQRDSTGQVVEYEHGYLRQQARAARGVLKEAAGRRRAAAAAKRAPVPQFAVEPSCSVELLYELELNAPLPWICSGALPVNVWWRPVGGARLQPLVPSTETTVPSVADQLLMKLLLPFRERSAGCRGNRFLVEPSAHAQLVSALSDVTQVRWSCREADGGSWRLHPLAVPGESAGGCPWSVEFASDGAGGYRPTVVVHGCGGDSLLSAGRLLSAGGCVIAGDELRWLKLGGCFGMLAQWLSCAGMALRGTSLHRAVAMLAAGSGAEVTGLPADMQSEVVSLRPTGRLYVTTARFKHLGQEQLQAELSYDYAGSICSSQMADDPASPMRFPAADGSGRVVERTPDGEEALRQELRECGFRLVSRRNGDEEPGWKLLPAQLDGAVRRLVLSGWQVTAEGKSYRRPVEGSGFTVSSFGIDWLDVRTAVDFGDGVQAEFPELLRAAAKGGGCVRLDDGTYGILPQEWLERFTALVEIGESTDKGVRLRQEQALLLKGLLAEQLKDLDGRYAQIAKRLSERPEALPSEAPPCFRAKLRPYQCVAVGWLRGLESAGLGGILADDMGLGKTIETLALLAWRRLAKPAAPALVVVPSSLLFNWERELEKFAPELAWREYYGASRRLEPQVLASIDVLFTTYGTLRQDVAKLAQITFDYVVLDEAQAIKNAESATAQAARALKARYRLTMSGTPVENHLSELFSQLGFLNPGLFSRRFAEHLGRENGIVASPEAVQALRQAVAPFVLRRRKEQVAKELPPKSEQVLWCEMEGPQLELYRQLQEYYRQEFSTEAAKQPQPERGNGAATANMLSALLRLRQAACAAALVNESCAMVPSAKIAVLMEQVTSLAESGHKVLVFSQFTRLLHLVEDAVTAAGLKYSYLDGATADRAEQVRRFQEDDEVKLFLISLKAGGVGLNLTAADYVFVMDPWWNPAAEAQAIDRAYRIGQTRPVFAYRIIARGSIEEKVLQMQERKRAIAAAALGNGSADAEALPPGITAEELRTLLDGSV